MSEEGATSERGAMVARVPSEQRVRYEITPLKGKFLTAQNVGGQLRAIADVITAVGKANDEKYYVGVASIDMDVDTGKLTFDLIVMLASEEGDAKESEHPA